MRQEYGIAFAVLAMGAVAWFYQSKVRGTMPAFAPPTNVVTLDAGNIPPQTAVSNDPADLSGWDAVPFYLRSNFPDNRSGSGVLPAVVASFVPDEFNPQEINPQF